MTASNVISISSRRSSAGPVATNAGPEFIPTVAAANDGSGETFTRMVRNGRTYWLTSYGIATRYNGHWFVQRKGELPRAVTATLADDLDAAERRAS